MEINELQQMLSTIIEQNRQIIAMLSGQWTAFGGYIGQPNNFGHPLSNTYGAQQTPLSKPSDIRQSVPDSPHVPDSPQGQIE